MASTPPSFFRRIGLALSVLFNAELAAKLQRVRGEGEPPADETPITPVAPVAEPQAVIVRETTPEAALQLLGLLQREARFVDFVQEDVTAYADADIGAAARVVHEGCRKVLREHFDIEPVRSEPEGSRITLAEGFDAAAVRLTGKVVGKPPFTGSLGHRGWRVADTRLPKLAEGHDASVIAQAEVEL
ncbi:MAG TPA: DUF2760 domain-containing protein [Thauera sp.]|uniref:DUF2760 domain-containing protein n=1 Tax=Thauera sp. TaxID=1905334 RepID=UPI002C2A93D2|nr:DUF2760 domain-containing protein [Thauera sp.]HRP23906.1 DUF2760 domain-containing protein [Thauera sp.]HRP67640.1 DUF2760 domain-containing protein [Thauera sp.]